MLELKMKLSFRLKYKPKKGKKETWRKKMFRRYIYDGRNTTKTDERSATSIAFR